MKKKKLTNINYLTQQKLGEILSKHFNVESEAKIDGTRFKSDFKFERNGKIYRVEFDGDTHFTDIAVMDRDIKKDELIWASGEISIRIPYFIQLESNTFRMFFGFDYPEPLIMKYPHGFIDSKAKTPAYFCNRGLDRFDSIMLYLSEKCNYVYTDIIHSMVHHKKANDFSYIIPQGYHYNRMKELAEYLAEADLFDYRDKTRKLLRKFGKMKFGKHQEAGFGFSF